MEKKEIVKRKANRLPQYDYGQNGAYFVTLCTKHRKHILSDIVGDDAHIVLKPCGRIAQRYIEHIEEVKAYVIMPNHIHLLIQIDHGAMWASPPTTSVPTIVRSFKTLVTKTIGAPIFQRSYYDHVVRNERDFEEIWEYIENNPIRWQEDRFYR